MAALIVSALFGIVTTGLYFAFWLVVSIFDLIFGGNHTEY
jgi:hypothetical protein